MAGHLLLAGYLGAGNLGDDAVMLGLVHGLGGSGYTVTAMSGVPEETYRLYGIPTIPRRDLKAYETALAKCDAVVFPGGSIFQDTSSVGSVAFYHQLVQRAKKANKKVLLLGQGVGPLKSFFGKRMARQAFDLADGITVRDPGSMQAIRDLGCNRPVRVAADSAFLLPMPTGSGEAEGFNVGTMRSVGIAPRPVKDKGRDIAGLFGEFCRLLYGAGSMPVLIPMDRTVDTPLIDEISKRQGGKIPDLRKVNTPTQIQQRIARMDGIVAMRLHAGILAATVGVPSLMVSYDPKVAAFAKLMEAGSALGMEGLTAPRMFDAYVAYQKDRERNARVLARRREEQAKAAEASVEMVREIVK